MIGSYLTPIFFASLLRVNVVLFDLILKLYPFPLKSTNPSLVFPTSFILFEGILSFALESEGVGSLVEVVADVQPEDVEVFDAARFNLDRISYRREVRERGLAYCFLH